MGNCPVLRLIQLYIVLLRKSSFDRMVGKANESYIIVNDVKCKALIDSGGGVSDVLSVCPRVVSVKGRFCRLPVRIFNMTAKVVEVKPKTTLCTLSEVKVILHIDFDSCHSVSDNSEPSIESLGIKISGDLLPQDTKSRLRSSLEKWKSVFSKGSSDIGHSDLLEHGIT